MLRSSDGTDTSWLRRRRDRNRALKVLLVTALLFWMAVGYVWVQNRPVKVGPYYIYGPLWDRSDAPSSGDDQWRIGAFLVACPVR